MTFLSLFEVFCNNYNFPKAYFAEVYYPIASPLKLFLLQQTKQLPQIPSQKSTTILMDIYER